MTNYSIDDGHGNQLCAGLQGYDAALKAAQRRANDLGEAVTLYAPVAISNVDEDGVVEGEVVEPETVRCECCVWSGHRCAWVGAPSDTVVVEWMPVEHHGSHEAAGNRGAYPANGARRLRVSQECSAVMLANDGAWCEVVEGKAAS